MSRSPVRTVPAASAVDDQTRPDPAAPDGDARRSLLTPAVLVGVVVALPLVIQAVRLVLLGGNLWPTDDRALLELSIHDVGVHPVWLGPYSRFHWNHPGPLFFYLVAPLYRLFGTRSTSLNIGALVINAVTGGGMLLVAWRMGGRRLALWAALLLALWMRFLGPQVLQDAWNPYVTILAFGLLVLLAWLLARGSVRALPFVAFTASFVVQTHISYLPSTCAVLGVAIVLGAIVVVRRARAMERARRVAFTRDVARWIGLAAAVALVVWMLPIAEQFRHHPGNMTRIEQFLRSAKPSETFGHAVSVTVREVGVLPRAVLPLSTARRMFPDSLGFGIATLVLFAGALALAARRRAWDVLRLGALALALLAAAVWSVDHIVGGFEFYLVTWVSATSFVVWLTIGASLLVPARARSREPMRAPARRGAWSGSVAVLAAAALVATSVNVAAAVHVPTPEPNSAIMRAIADGAVDATRGNRGPVLVINDPVQWPATAGVILQLEKHGITARVPPQWGWLFGARLAVHPERATALVTIVSARAQPPARPGQRRVADFGGLATWVAPRTAGSAIPPDPPTTPLP